MIDVHNSLHPLLSLPRPYLSLFESLYVHSTIPTYGDGINASILRAFSPSNIYQLTTSAGLVFISRAYSLASLASPVAVPIRPFTLQIIPDMSSDATSETDRNSAREMTSTVASRPRPASRARLGSLSLPSVEYYASGSDERGEAV